MRPVERLYITRGPWTRIEAARLLLGGVESCRRVGDGLGSADSPASQTPRSRPDAQVIPM